MMTTILKKLTCLFISFSIIGLLKAQKQLTVFANKPVTEVPSTMWGVFFEDINFSADGGLYAELIKNRSFEFSTPLMGWKEIKPKTGTGKLLIMNQGAISPQNSRFANIKINTTNSPYGLSNEGFRGIGVTRGKQYRFSILARKAEATDVNIRVELINASGAKIGEARIDTVSDKWVRHNVIFTVTATENKARFNVLFEGKGCIDVDMISLFPVDTWKNRPFGLRADLVQMLADLKPNFVRFPGGCIVEGRELETRYQWKKTVGEPENRTPIVNRWNTEFKHRLTADYYQTFGLGFFEYFQLSEDLGAEPLPILNCGMACQYNTSEVAPIDQLNTYIQDALDLVEFANGADTTKWGKLRSGMGHPKPFNLKMLGVGNEQWDEQYIERYKEFEKAFKARYPEIKLVAAAGPSPSGPRFDYLWAEFKKLSPNFLDEHYYQPSQWFFNNASRYDNYDRKGPKVFAGEYAAHNKDVDDPEGKNTWLSALSEAAFMTGLERNAEVVQMSSYAPLLAHVDAWQWRPDLIWFDNLRAIATPNYFVQKLFSVNKGTHVVPVLEEGKILAGKDSIYACSTIDRKAGVVIIKVVNNSPKNAPVIFKIEGVALLNKPGTIDVLTANNLTDFNTLKEPQKVAPQQNAIKANKNTLAVSLAPSSFNVFRLPYKN
ncbi:MAG: alpha-L-arabinofuranosidase, partial [Segetibacter sp.]|nr:alpha-L-arabinofuranosidase [Segetibacter sp.]